MNKVFFQIIPLVCIAIIGINVFSANAAPRLLNTWHIPTNPEPPSVTMRNPVHPTSADTAVYLYVGAYPHPTLWGATLKYRVNAGTYSSIEFAWDSVQPDTNNEYWIVNIPGPLTDGDVYEYYIDSWNNVEHTYVYGTDDTTNTTGDEATAAAAPYGFTIGAGAPTATPTIFGTPTNTPTSGPTRTPTLTPTQQIPASATPTPVLHDAEVSIKTNLESYSAGDLFELDLSISNPGRDGYVDVYVVLNIGDGFWFWPQWTESITYRRMQIEPRHNYEQILLLFEWPSGANGLSASFTAALMEPGTYTIISLSSWNFSAN